MDDLILLAPSAFTRSVGSIKLAGSFKVSASVSTTEKPSTAPEIVLQPIKEISGTINLPGSKSLSNRILLLAALAELVGVKAMAKIISMPICPRTVELLSLKCCKTGNAIVGPSACFDEGCHRISYTRCFFHVNHSSLGKHYKRSRLTLRSSLDGSISDPSSSSNSSNGGTRLTRTIEAIRTKLGSRLKEIRKNLPIKLLFFFIGFYCATAFATVIGQTGDWDILSAALAVVVVEGIGALMYKASFPVLNKIRSLITMFNYWKAGLSMGLFLDSFKYELAGLLEINDTILFAASAFFMFL